MWGPNWVPGLGAWKTLPIPGGGEGLGGLPKSPPSWSPGTQEPDSSAAQNILWLHPQLRGRPAASHPGSAGGREAGEGDRTPEGKPLGGGWDPFWHGTQGQVAPGCSSLEIRGGACLTLPPHPRAAGWLLPEHGGCAPNSAGAISCPQPLPWEDSEQALSHPFEISLPGLGNASLTCKEWREGARNDERSQVMLRCRTCTCGGGGI